MTFARLMLEGLRTFGLTLVAVVAGGYVASALLPQPIYALNSDGSIVEVRPAKQAGPPARSGNRSAMYFEFDPAFVVNIVDQGEMRMLDINVAVLARDEDSLEAVKQNSPALRSKLIDLLEGRDYRVLLTRDGKEALRQECVGALQNVLAHESGRAAIEDVYFTNLIMQ
jgi:flagellar protein FliL